MDTSFHFKDEENCFSQTLANFTLDHTVSNATQVSFDLKSSGSYPLYCA